MSSSSVPRRSAKRRLSFGRSSSTVRRRLFANVPTRPPRVASGMSGDSKVYSFVQTVSILQNTSGIPASSGFVVGTSTNDAYVIGAATGTPGTPANANGALAFQLNDLDQAGSFTALFDEYRINMVVVEFSPIFNENAIANAVGTKAGQIYVMHDFNDNTQPTNLTEFRARQDVRSAAAYEKLSIAVKPRVAAAALNAAGSVIAPNPKSGLWLKTDQTNIPHYGVKYSIANMADTSVPKWIVRMKYFLQFRNVA